MSENVMDYPLRPDGIKRKPTAQERKAIYYHHFHDTLDANCNACAWEDTI